MRLAEYRKRDGLTQADVAEILKVPVRTYQNYEREVRTPDLATLCALTDRYRVTLDELVGRSDAPDLPCDRDESKLLCEFRMMSETGRMVLLTLARDIERMFPE